MTLDQQARALLANGPLRQPDRRSCGAATLVFAEMIRNPGYAARVRRSFADESLAMHARVTGPADVAGRLQLPWPRALGTPPWAITRHLTARWGASYATRIVRRHRRLDLTVTDRPAVLYVGSRWLPRHVVLIVAADDDSLRCYEPSSGKIVDLPTLISAPDWRIAGWGLPWFVVQVSRSRR